MLEESSGWSSQPTALAGWHNLPVIEPLERDLGTVVISSIPAQVWVTQKRLHLRAPVKGYGRLLEEML